MTDTTIDVDGVDIAVTDEGEGRPLVFLHGGGRTLADWLFVAPKLTDEFRVVCVDFRGHGRSAAVPAYSFDDGVADCAGVIDGLGLDDAVVIGHSLGGMTAVHYGARVGRCAAVINVDGFGAGSVAEFPGIPEEETHERLARWAQLSEASFRDEPDRGDEAWMRQHIDVFRNAIERMGIEWSMAEQLIARGYRQIDDTTWETSPDADVNASMYRSLYDMDHWVMYEKLDVPTLVIRSVQHSSDGLDDAGDIQALDVFNANVADRLDDLVARGRIKLEPYDTGHMVMWEKPAELVASIRRFVGAL